jgi:hypothetical protein
VFLIYEGMDYEGSSLVGCRSSEEAAVERARELAQSPGCHADSVFVVEYPDGDFDTPAYQYNENIRRVIEYRTRDCNQFHYDFPVEEPEAGPEFDTVPVQFGSSRESRKATGKNYLPAGGPTRASIRRRVNRAAKRSARRN